MSKQHHYRKDRVGVHRITLIFVQVAALPGKLSTIWMTYNPKSFWPSSENIFPCILHLHPFFAPLSIPAEFWQYRLFEYKVNAKSPYVRRIFLLLKLSSSAFYWQVYYWPGALMYLEELPGCCVYYLVWKKWDNLADMLFFKEKKPLVKKKKLPEFSYP